MRSRVLDAALVAAPFLSMVLAVLIDSAKRWPR